MNETFPQRVFSGVQPTGYLHLGNYLGAIMHFVPLQDVCPCLYCIVDLHAITVPQDPEKLQGAIREVTAVYLAAGIDPRKSIIFNQSRVCAHAELAWIFSCVARMGWLGRMTQFKEKAGKNRENASVGLFTYPILMAADILAYKATHVPVGDDQKQHLELARDIAQKFNHDFQDRLNALSMGMQNRQRAFFPLPEPLSSGTAPRIMSLRDGLKKMSKSDPSDLSRIHLTDSPDEISYKIRKAKSDTLPLPETEETLPQRPEAANLIGIYATLTGNSVEQVLKECAGMPFSTFKPRLAQCLIETLRPLSEKIRLYRDDPAEIDRILHDGAHRAETLARETLMDVRRIFGFV